MNKYNHEAWEKQAARAKEDGTHPPDPPLNLKQREIARELLSVIRMLHEGRHEDSVQTSQRIRDAGLRTSYLLQGLAGAGKSELFKAMDRVMQRLELGSFVVTAWMNVHRKSIHDLAPRP